MAGVSQVSPSDWIQGARLRTLPLAIAPVVLGVSSAILAGGVEPWPRIFSAGGGAGASNWREFR